MRRMKLAAEGPECSAIAYGLWRLADDPEGASIARIRDKIDTCLEYGITTFDHADIYGLYTCEGLFGSALAEVPELRERMEIVTKCGIRYTCDALPDNSVKHYDATSESIQSCVERSLAELQTDYIDLLLIHRPDWLTRAEDTAEGLSTVIDQGKVRAVGVSNYSTSQVELLSAYLARPIVTNQIEVNLLQMDPIYDGTLNQCEQRSIHPMAWSPLAGGRLLDDDDVDAVRTREALRKIAEKCDATPTQIALAWVAALPSEPLLIVGTNQRDRIREAAESQAITLTRKHWYQLWEAARGRQVP